MIKSDLYRSVEDMNKLCHYLAFIACSIYEEFCCKMQYIHICKFKIFAIEATEIQSDLGYPATSGPALFRISDLSRYGSYA